MTPECHFFHFVMDEEAFQYRCLEWMRNRKMNKQKVLTQLPWKDSLFGVTSLYTNDSSIFGSNILPIR